jgi:hypothetical protein
MSRMSKALYFCLRRLSAGVRRPDGFGLGLIIGSVRSEDRYPENDPLENECHPFLSISTPRLIYSTRL